MITLVIVANTAVGVTQEVKADRAISALSAMAAPVARVLRDGSSVTFRPRTWSWVIC